MFSLVCPGVLEPQAQMMGAHWLPRVESTGHTLDEWLFRLRESVLRKEENAAQSRAAKHHLLEVLTPKVSPVPGEVIILRHRPSLQSVLNTYLWSPD